MMPDSYVGERVSLVYVPRSQSTEGSQDKSSRQEPGDWTLSRNHEKHWLLASFLWLTRLAFLHTLEIFSRMALSRVLWALPHQLLRKMPYRLAYRTVCEVFSQITSLFQDDSTYIKLTKSQTKTKDDVLSPWLYFFSEQGCPA